MLEPVPRRTGTAHRMAPATFLHRPYRGELSQEVEAPRLRSQSLRNAGMTFSANSSSVSG